MSGQGRPSRHHRTGIAKLPSIAAWVEGNRKAAAQRRERAIGRLVCQERGCAEGLATIEIDPDATPLRLHVAVSAPWFNEVSTDPLVLHRIRLRGATDQISDAVYLTVKTWPKGSRIELVCRLGHLSKFGAGHLAQRMRGVLK